MPRDVDDSADRSRSNGEVARAMLLGRDYTGPGAMATSRAGARTAVGIARGWRPKPYAYVDPNEDAVAAVAGETAQLLVVADGHNGHRASHVALEAIVDALGAAPPPADLDDDDMLALFVRADQAIAAAAPPFGPRTRTTLVVALRTVDTLQWAGAGDSALLVVGGGATGALPAQTSWFCGDHLSPSQMRGSLARGRNAVPPQAWVALATDGYTDYLPVPRPPAEATQAFLRGVADPADAAEALLRQARRGGAGDNVGVSISGPW
ncbi:MAG TPA: protein phosphatase 2C domain-containing protein [Euzebyales bacterium]|nr:protein phosphatase 2C domain-containing protein [Euzebyales bacterium]